MRHGRGRITNGRQLPAPRRSFEVAEHGWGACPRPTGSAPIRIGPPPAAGSLDPAGVRPCAHTVPSSHGPDAQRGLSRTLGVQRRLVLAKPGSPSPKGLTHSSKSTSCAAIVHPRGKRDPIGPNTLAAEFALAEIPSIFANTRCPVLPFSHSVTSGHVRTKQTAQCAIEHRPGYGHPCERRENVTQFPVWHLSSQALRHQHRANHHGCEQDTRVNSEARDHDHGERSPSQSYVLVGDRSCAGLTNQCAVRRLEDKANEHVDSAEADRDQRSTEKNNKEPL